jgi:hypothetical protein
MSTYLDEHARDAAAELGTGAEVSITFRHHGAMLRVSSSNSAAARCDQTEIRMDEGPCVDALSELVVVDVPDVGAGDRWPHWAERVVAEGFRACVAVPAPITAASALALNVYLDDAGRWGEAVQRTAVARATQVADDVRERLVVAALAADRVATTSDRAALDRAAGVVMQGNDVGPDEARALIARTAVERGVEPVEVARELLTAVPRGPATGG